MSEREQINPRGVRLVMALVGGALGCIAIPIMNMDYFLRFAPDKISAVYAIPWCGICCAVGWLVHSPRSWRSGIVNAVVALLCSLFLAYLFLHLHVNSVYNHYGNWSY